MTPSSPPPVVAIIQERREEVNAATDKNINCQIGAEISWSRTHDRSARTAPARKAFLDRFEREVDPEGKLPPQERHERARHALRAHMLSLAKRSAAAREKRP